MILSSDNAKPFPNSNNNLVILAVSSFSISNSFNPLSAVIKSNIYGFFNNSFACSLFGDGNVSPKLLVLFSNSACLLYNLLAI